MLGERVSLVADQAIPTFFTVTPNGEVAVVVEGEIIATGFQLEEALVEGEKINSLKWLDSVGVLREQISGSGNGKTAHQLQMEAIGGPSGAVRSVVYINQNNLEGYVRADAGKFQRMIITGQNESDFLKLLTTANWRVNAGVVNVLMESARTDTNAAVVSHGMGTTPIAIIGTVNLLGGAIGGIFAEVMSSGLTTFNIRCLRPFGAPGVNTNFQINWIAIG